jgi:DNA sulfur modification protein DndD
VKLTRIVLENVFAYDRKVDLNLDVVTPGKNIILIWGRNGMGKTSFLNALKLLFLGADDEFMRHVGFPPKKLSASRYVLGDEGSWSGIINQRFRERALAKGESVTARVLVEWVTTDGQPMGAERRWTELPGATYREDVSYWDGQERLTKDSAEERLRDFMPPEFVHFFFFDGEYIKHLAETDEPKTIDFDRLLRITFLQILGSELHDIAKERSRSAKAEGLRDQIASSEEALTRAHNTLEADGQRVEELDERIASAQVELRRLSTRREDLSSGASEAQRGALEKRIAELKRDLEESEVELSETLPVNAPLIANLSLVQLALSELTERVAAAGAAEQVMANRIQQELPSWLAQEQLPLSPEGIQRLADALAGRIHALVAPSVAAGLFGSMHLVTAEQIQRQLTLVLLAGERDRDDAVRLLTRVRRFRREYAEGREELLRLEVGSQASLEEYRRTVLRISELDTSVSEWLQTRGLLHGRVAEAELEEQRLLAALQGLRAQQEQELQLNKESWKIRKLAGACEDLRSAIRKSARGRVEALINERFNQLLFGEGVVERIRIDDDYTLSFLSHHGTLIGRSSLSSGVKQLAATAFLWAMKDAVGEDMPVAIDTPLGRLDRENQDQMLLKYYPELSRQVIVLPTNTEIDERKLKLLEPHIAFQYRIVSQNGEDADIVKGSLIDVSYD